jgi:hypothetical protein
MPAGCVACNAIGRYEGWLKGMSGSRLDLEHYGDLGFNDCNSSVRRSMPDMA